MSNIALIYWLTRLSNISGLFFTAAFLTSIIFGLGLIFYSMSIVNYPTEKEEIEFKAKRKWLKNRLWIPILLWIIMILTPNTKEAMLIIAGGKTLDYVQTDTSLNKIPYKATELILKKMDEYIDEIAKPDQKDSFHKKIKL